MSFLDTFFRCNCPVTSALDIVGDKWTLVVIKLMLLEQKKTFKEFSESDESIAPSILSNRLKTLEKIGFIVKQKLPDNQKTNHYFLTEKGLSLTPIIIASGQLDGLLVRQCVRGETDRCRIRR